MSTFSGTGILFALADVTHTLAGIAAFNTDLMQSLDVSDEIEKEEVKNKSGTTKAVAHYDRKAKATMEFVPNGGTNTGVVSITAWPTVGGTLTITNATFAPIGAAWFIDGITFTRSNTKALMARVSLTRYIDGSLPA